MSRTVDDVYVASNISATTAAFTLQGGKYGVDYIATWSAGNVALQKQAADGATFVTVITAFTANGYSVIDLPVGIYRLLVTTATAIYITITRIQGE